MCAMTFAQTSSTVTRSEEKLEAVLLADLARHRERTPDRIGGARLRVREAGHAEHVAVEGVMCEEAPERQNERRWSERVRHQGGLGLAEDGRRLVGSSRQGYPAHARPCVRRNDAGYLRGSFRRRTRRGCYCFECRRVAIASIEASSPMNALNPICGVPSETHLRASPRSRPRQPEPHATLTSCGY